MCANNLVSFSVHIWLQEEIMSASWVTTLPATQHNQSEWVLTSHLCRTNQNECVANSKVRSPFGFIDFYRELQKVWTTLSSLEPIITPTFFTKTRFLVAFYRSFSFDSLIVLIVIIGSTEARKWWKNTLEGMFSKKGFIHLLFLIWIFLR